MTPTIETVWRRIEAVAGEPFATKTGKPFTFEVAGRVLHTSRTEFALPKSDFATALEEVPIDRPGTLSDRVRGPAYVWAILHDPRVRQGDW